MNLDRFLRERGPAWDELESLLDRAGRRPERLGQEGILRLAALYRAAGERHGGVPAVPAGLRQALASVIFVNNIRVSFLAFAGGAAVCFGTAWVLLTNGLLLGTVGGLATGAGNWRFFVDLVTAHGVL